MKEKTIFITKVTVIHVLTYTVCGLLAMNIFHYTSNMTEIGLRPADSLIVGLAPVFQIIRGILFGIALWFFRDTFAGKKLGWLKLWIILVILGILNTPGPGEGSIERMIYYESRTDMKNLTYGGMSEILIQTLIFSILTSRIKQYGKRAG